LVLAALNNKKRGHADNKGVGISESRSQVGESSNFFSFLNNRIKSPLLGWEGAWKKGKGKKEKGRKKKVKPFFVFFCVLS
jgi:hypothetical protein